MKENTIAFVLPSNGLKPAGGYKVVYKYANLFSRAGFNVEIFYTFRFYRSFNPAEILKNIYHFIKFFIFKNYKCKKWFILEHNVRESFLFYSHRRYMNYEKIIATALETSFIVDSLKVDANVKKFYFIQDFENWNGKTEEDVFDSYKLPLKKIVIAPWLKEKVESIGETASVVMNGFDFDDFKKNNSIENRNPFEVVMMYHDMDRKRCCDSIAALKRVKIIYPQLNVVMFGVPDRTVEIPEWVTYFKKPNKIKHNSIYNNASIYVAASDIEGFGLTIGEAMQCGCAVVCTDNGGFICMAKNNETALVSPCRNVDKLVENIIFLIEHNEFRIQIAEKGFQFIQNFTWEKSFETMKKVLSEKN